MTASECGRKSIAFRLIMACVLLSQGDLFAGRADGQDTGLSQSLTRIAAGTKVGVSNASRWNRLLLLAKPRLASGDLDNIGETIRVASTAFSLTIMAHVKPYTALDGSKRFLLADVGVGYSVPIKGVQTVISYQTVQQQGADPGFIARQVLSANEERLADLEIVARSSTSLVFDAPAIVHRGGKHQDYLARHLIWFDPSTGSGAMGVWLLQQGANNRLAVVAEPIKWVPMGTKEDRKIHVDGEQFTLGIPAEHAFALENLPPGKSIPWNKQLKPLAALPRYRGHQIDDLLRALTTCLHGGQASEHSTLHQSIDAHGQNNPATEAR